jgi:hypothetical protein
MSMEGVLSHPSRLRLRGMCRDDRSEERGIRDLGALGADLDKPLAGQGFKGQEEAPGAVARLFMVFPPGGAGLQG